VNLAFRSVRALIYQHDLHNLAESLMGGVYKDPEKRRLVHRGNMRTSRHGNWRQTYIDCMGVCVAKINGGEICGETEHLELHECFGENGHRNDPKFQIRVLVCGPHHALIDDHYHQSSFIAVQPNPSYLSGDVCREIQLVGGYSAWLARYKLDDSRFGCLSNSGPCVEDCGDG